MYDLAVSMDTSEAIRQRIMELCNKKRWAFNALANYSGIPASTLKNIISKHCRNPGIVTIKKICDGLEISLTDFFDTEIFRNMEREIK